MGRSLAEIKADGKLTVAFIGPGSAFFSKTADGSDGFDSDVLTKLAQKLGLTVQVSEVSNINELLQALEAGSVEVIAGGLGYTPQRAARVDYTQPVTPQCDVAVTLAPNPPAQSVADVKRRQHVGVIEGTPSERAALSAGLSQKQLVGLHAQSPMVVLAALRAGTVDVAITGLYFAVSMQAMDPKVRIGTLLGDRGYHAYAVRKGDAELLAVLNQFLSTLRATNVWYAMARRHFGPTAPDTFRRCRASERKAQ